MVIDNQPAPTAIPVDEAVPRGTNDVLPVADLRESIGPAVDGHVAIDANTLLTKDDLVRRRNGAQYVEVATNRFGVVRKLRRAGAPHHRLRIVESQNSLDIVAGHGVDQACVAAATSSLGPADVSNGKPRIKTDTDRTRRKLRIIGTPSSVDRYTCGSHRAASAQVHTPNATLSGRGEQREPVPVERVVRRLYLRDLIIMAYSYDLVRPQQHPRRNRQPERLRRLETIWKDRPTYRVYVDCSPRGKNRATGERRPVMEKDTTYVALDDSKRTITAGILRPGEREPELRQIPNEPRLLRRLVERLTREGPVHVCYEAGVSGYDLHRQLTALRLHCDVMAPALTRAARGSGSRRIAATRPSSSASTARAS